MIVDRIKIDHDTSLSNLEYDRKLSVFVSCSPNGVLEIEGQHINVGKGDAIVFSSMSGLSNKFIKYTGRLLKACRACPCMP